MSGQIADLAAFHYEPRAYEGVLVAGLGVKSAFRVQKTSPLNFAM